MAMKRCISTSASHLIFKKICSHQRQDFDLRRRFVTGKKAPDNVVRHLSFGYRMNINSHVTDAASVSRCSFLGLSILIETPIQPPLEQRENVGILKNSDTTGKFMWSPLE
jgi:hypothetical protein